MHIPGGPSPRCAGSDAVTKSICRAVILSRRSREAAEDDEGPPSYLHRTHDAGGTSRGGPSPRYASLRRLPRNSQCLCGFARARHGAIDGRKLSRICPRSARGSGRQNLAPGASRGIAKRGQKRARVAGDRRATKSARDPTPDPFCRPLRGLALEAPRCSPGWRRGLHSGAGYAGSGSSPFLSLRRSARAVPCSG